MKGCKKQKATAENAKKLLAENSKLADGKPNNGVNLFIPSLLGQEWPKVMLRFGFNVMAKIMHRLSAHSSASHSLLKLLTSTTGFTVSKSFKREECNYTKHGN